MSLKRPKIELLVPRTSWQRNGSDVPKDSIAVARIQRRDRFNDGDRDLHTSTSSAQWSSGQDLLYTG